MRVIRIGPRQIVAIAGMASLAVGLALGCAPATPSPAEAPRDPIKIGILMPLTGPLTANGERATTGARTFFETRNMEVAGRPVEFIVEDTEANPQVGITKTRKLVESDQVHALIAYISTPVTYANRDYLTAQQMPTVLVSGANALVHPGSEQFSPYMFRSFGSLYGNGDALAEWLYNGEGLRSVVLTALDFGGAIEPAYAFRHTFEELGGTVVAEIRPPLATADWSPWVSQIGEAARQAEAVVTWVYAIDAIRMVQVWDEVGLKGTIPIYGGEAFTSEMLLPSMGEAAVDIWQFGSYCPTIDTPENQEFFDAVQAKGNYPAEYDFYGWSAAQTLYEAIQAVDGNVEDRDALAEALRQVSYVGPAGPFRFDQHHNPIVTMYMQKVELIDGAPHNVCTGSVENVGHPGHIPFPPQ